MKLRKLTAIFVTLILIAILLLQIRVKDINEIFSNSDPLFIVATIPVYLLLYLFRSIRFYSMLSFDGGLDNMFSIVCIHNLANAIMPARTGELSFVYLSKRSGISTGKGLATLIVSRGFDFLAISLLFVVVLLNASLPPPFTSLGLVGGITIFIAFGFLLGFIKFGNSLATIVLKLRNKIDFHPFRWCLSKIIETLESASVVKTTREIFIAAFCSLGIWLCMILINYLLFLAFGIKLELVELVVLVGAATILPIIFFYGLGGFGTIEVAYASVLILFGFPKGIAILASFGVHIVTFLYILIFGAYGSWRLNISNFLGD
tara:strand:+ start:2634 stop:3587 length:954 start_codon:yes stop_codon:yes gene_type:complete